MRIINKQGYALIDKKEYVNSVNVTCLNEQIMLFWDLGNS